MTASRACGRCAAICRCLHRRRGGFHQRLGHGLCLIIGERARVEENLTAGPDLVGHQVGHLQVRECAVGVVVWRAELADVKQRGIVELRQQAGVELVDVAKVGLVGVTQPRLLDEQLDVVVVFLGRRRDAEHGAVGTVLGEPQADDVVVAGAEVEHRFALDGLFLQVLDQMQIAGALHLIETPGLVPVVELVHACRPVVGPPLRCAKLPSPVPDRPAGSVRHRARAAAVQAGGHAGRRAPGAGRG